MLELSKTEILLLAAGAVVLAAALGYVVGRCVGRKQGRKMAAEFVCPTEEKETPAVPDGEETPDEPEEAESLDDIVQAFEQKDLRDLLLDRLEMLGENEPDSERWAMELVDLLDEIKWMGGLEPTDKARVPLLRAKLIEQLQAAGGELIDEDTWSPERQRAVKVSRTLPDGASPRIVEKGASGLIFKDRLLRKQEVSLEKAP